MSKTARRTRSSPLCAAKSRTSLLREIVLRQDQLVVGVVAGTPKREQPQEAEEEEQQQQWEEGKTQVCRIAVALQRPPIVILVRYPPPAQVRAVGVITPRIQRHRRQLQWMSDGTMLHRLLLQQQAWTRLGNNHAFPVQVRPFRSRWTPSCSSWVVAINRAFPAFGVCWQQGVARRAQYAVWRPARGMALNAATSRFDTAATAAAAAAAAVPQTSQRALPHARQPLYRLLLFLLRQCSAAGAAHCCCVAQGLTRGTPAMLVAS